MTTTLSAPVTPSGASAAPVDTPDATARSTNAFIWAMVGWFIPICSIVALFKIRGAAENGFRIAAKVIAILSLVAWTLFAIVTVAFILFVDANKPSISKVQAPAPAVSQTAQPVPSPGYNPVGTPNGAAAKTPQDLMALLAGKDPTVANATIDSIQVLGDQGWLDISPTTDISRTGHSRPVVIYFTDTSGTKRRAGFEHLGDLSDPAKQSWLINPT